MKSPKPELRRPKEDRNLKPETRSWHLLNHSRFGLHALFEIRSSLFGVVTAAFCLSAWAQPYGVDWHTIDGGGGTSTGGVYSVSGTIGQPDARATPMTGGQYAVTGGFWALYAIQTPGAPLLSIVAAGPGQATVSWEPDTPGWVLQETLSLSPTNWVDSSSGSTNPIVVPATLPTKLYRLHQP